MGRLASPPSASLGERRCYSEPVASTQESLSVMGKPGLTVPAFFWRIPLAETDPLPDEMNHSTTKVGSETSEPLRYIRMPGQFFNARYMFGSLS
ncbi:unnamed protein product [Arctogadus glacialis]